MTEKLAKLLSEKKDYENATNNTHLQEKELNSIATAMLLQLVNEANLEADEKEAFEWAKKQIRGE